MTRIGLISDTHGWLDEQVFKYFQDCHEIWHAGDFGNIEVSNSLAMGQTGHGFQKILRGVYGNIDGIELRNTYPEKLHFTCEQVNVFMTHIGGHPAKYHPGIKQELIQHKSNLFICGHSHILKIIYDDKLNCLHINPGAAGKQGWHQMRTIIRLTIDGNNMKDCEVIELGKR
jgi:putative phosphoesterase